MKKFLLNCLLVTLCYQLLHVDKSFAEGEDYLFASHDTGIFRFNADGSVGKEIIKGGYGSIRGVKFDSVKGYVYFLTYDGALWRIKRNGHNLTKIVETGMTGANDFQLYGDQLYVCLHQGISVIQLTSNIVKHLDIDIPRVPDRSSKCSSIAISGEENKLYFLNRDSREIKRANLDGTNIETVFKVVPKEGEILSEFQFYTLTISPSTNRIYWADERTYLRNTPTEGFFGQYQYEAAIRSVRLNGSGFMTVIPDYRLPTGMTGGNDFTLDEESGLLYWKTSFNGRPQIWVSNIDGSQPRLLRYVDNLITSMVVDSKSETLIYNTYLCNDFYQVSKNLSDETRPARIRHSIATNIEALSIDPDNERLFFLERNCDNRIRSVDFDGKNPKSIVKTMNNVKNSKFSFAGNMVYDSPSKKLYFGTYFGEVGSYDLVSRKFGKVFDSSFTFSNIQVARGKDRLSWIESKTGNIYSRDADSESYIKIAPTFSGIKLFGTLAIDPMTDTTYLWHQGSQHPYGAAFRLENDNTFTEIFDFVKFYSASSLARRSKISTPNKREIEIEVSGVPPSVTMDPINKRLFSIFAGTVIYELQIKPMKFNGEFGWKLLSSIKSASHNYMTDVEYFSAKRK